MPSLGETNEVAERPRSWLQNALEDIQETFRDRGPAYTANKGEFRNFEEQARVAGVELRQTFRGMIAQKLSREMSLYEQYGPDSDKALDSVRDVLGYAWLWYAYHLSQQGLLPVTLQSLGGERE